MKTFRMIEMALFAVLMCVNFTSCSNEEVVPDEPTQEEYITVGLDCVGEYLNITESPMSRATGDDVYCIQIYTLEEEKDAALGTSYVVEKPYAHGNFETSLNDVTVKLLLGREYRFKVAIVIGASGEVSLGPAVTKYDTEFNYSITSSCNPSYFIPVIYEGFYGELDTYTPQQGTTENVSITTKRVSYGANFIAEQLSTGTLKIVVTNSMSDLYTVNLTSTTPSNSKIYSFTNVVQAWQGLPICDPATGNLIGHENYTSQKTLSINWEKTADNIIPLGSYNVTFKRNVKTTIRIKAEELSVSNGITISREDTPITDDSDEYVIEGGKVVVVPLNSSQS